MYLARNRWNSPPLGRWIERDPLGYVDGMGLYAYVRAGPLVWADPWGLSTATGDRWWAELSEVDCKPCQQPSNRDLVFDFEDGWRYRQPSGSIEIQTWAALVEALEREIAEGSAGKCWTIAGHGWGGVFSPREEQDDGLKVSGRTKEYLDDKLSRVRDDVRNEYWCRKMSETERGRETVQERRAMVRFFELARQHLADGGTLEFGGCEAGAGEKGRRFGEALAREMPGVSVLLYSDKVAWGRSRWMTRHDKSAGVRLLNGALLIFWMMEESAGPVEKAAVPLRFQCKRKCGE